MVLLIDVVAIKKITSPLILDLVSNCYRKTNLMRNFVLRVLFVPILVLILTTENQTSAFGTHCFWIADQCLNECGRSWGGYGEEYEECGEDCETQRAWCVFNAFRIDLGFNFG